MEVLLREAVARKASDLHIAADIPPHIRVDGQLIPLAAASLNAVDIYHLLEEIAQENQLTLFAEWGELDFSYAISGLSRFRVSAFQQRGTIAIIVRIINENIPSLKDLGFPPIVSSLARLPRGLVIVAGPTGSGKTTTLAALIDLINTERANHIITLEDPIEYLHKYKKSIVNQREIHVDTKSFSSGLRSALRSDPDVILVGEMRDLETIATALTAAETGHLVLATLHTSDAVQTIDRIIGVFPPQQQPQIRVQLSMSLQAVLAQQLLLKCTGGGRVAAVEILIATPAIRNLIREGKSHQIISMVQTGGRLGMQSMDYSLGELYCKGFISFTEALEGASDPDSFKEMINRQ